MRGQHWQVISGDLDKAIAAMIIATGSAAMDLMGFTREEMIDYPDLKYGGVAVFVAEAAKSKIQLFL